MGTNHAVVTVLKWPKKKPRETTIAMSLSILAEIYMGSVDLTDQHLSYYAIY